MPTIPLLYTLNQLERLIGTRRIRRQNAARAIEADFAVLKGHEQMTARLGDQQRAGGKVPGLERDLKEDVLPAAGDVGQIQRGRAAAADICGMEQELKRQLHAALRQHRMIGRCAEARQRS